MKRLLSILLLSTPILAFASNAQSGVMQALATINHNLSNIQNTQSEQSNILKSSLNLQINRSAPTSPYPNWAAIENAQSNMMPQANLQAPSSNAPKNAENLIESAQNNMNMAYHTQLDLSHNIKPFVTDKYLSAVHSASALGANRASNLLLLQDTKLLLALYQQQRTTQEILMAIALENRHNEHRGAAQ